MNTRIVLLSVLSFLLSPAVQAASEQIIWGKSNHYFSNPKSDKNKLQHQVKPNVYQLKRIEKEDGQDARHTRYQILYKNIPVLGHELIAHSGGSRGDFITGVDVTGIEDDVPSLNGKLSAEVVEQKIVAMINDPIVFKNTEKVIFLDSTNKAHLAYEVLLYTNSPETTVAEPHYIVDANSGSVLKEWNGLNTKKIGQGLGGNVLVLPYRGGLFQHGDSQKDIPSLGKFNVTVKGGNCFVETPNIRVINVNETSLNKNSFPVLSIVEMFTKLPTFSYPCNEQSKYVNKNDGNTAPANYSFSAVNDTMYFADVTFDMYKNYYGESRPLGDDLPLRAYTHVKHLDNAFAIPQVKVKGITIMHQQIVIGDGDNMLTAPAQGTIAHELSHNFTRLHSNLVYSEQSGGINESFSDMASIAMQDYLRNFYPWYWDGQDWSIGREATLGAAPIRYMDDPEKDGRSIGHADKYLSGMEVHETSGVFNKAFYLLANKPDWSIRQAFQVMIDANKKYWTSGTHYNAAACGVIQAAIDRNYGKQGAIDAFAEVGVVCPIASLTA